MMVMERASPRANQKEMITAAKARARRDRPRDIPAGTAGEEAAGIAGMIGAIPATAATTVEERAVAREKGRERAKDTPTGETSRGCSKKKEFAWRYADSGVPHMHFSSA